MGWGQKWGQAQYLGKVIEFVFGSDKAQELGDRSGLG